MMFSTGCLKQSEGYPRCSLTQACSVGNNRANLLASELRAFAYMHLVHLHNCMTRAWASLHH
eukprot:5614566-Amphidinium_carterae.1